MRKILILLLLTVSMTVVAQNKQGKVWTPLLLDYGKGKTEISTANYRAYYAFNAEDIKDRNTYLDLGMLEVGNTISKYSSAFVAHDDSLLYEWFVKHPKASAVPKSIEIEGRLSNYWSEYQYSELFIENNELTEWAVMPRNQERNCMRYTESFPQMHWSIGKDTLTICGHKCQNATCHYRGREFEAWFAPSIPIRKGPWKFGGLPGLIMKVYDKDHLYTFECVGLNNGKFLITQFDEKHFPIRPRSEVHKFQVKMNENWANLSGFIMPSRKDFYEYDPLELE